MKYKVLVFVWIWVIFNVFIGAYEIYCYNNKIHLKLNNFPKWNSSIIASWNEYCRVDPRCVLKKYVWIFELLNVFYVIISIFILLFDEKIIRIVLLYEILTCSLYFLTLIYEYNTDKTIRTNILQNSTLDNRIIYYGISSIWIIVPLYLFYII